MLDYVYGDFCIAQLAQGLGMEEQYRLLMSRAGHYTKLLDRELFSAKEDGLPGDEDNGSLCAWYIFVSMGMYPLCPGVSEYVTGSPLYLRMTLQLESGKQIVIEAEGKSSDHNPANRPYVHPQSC